MEAAVPLLNLAADLMHRLWLLQLLLLHICSVRLCEDCCCIVAAAEDSIRFLC
jgi:hypothetical protein